MAIAITSTLTIDERELDERFVRASGPGGQNVNKVATAVELRFDVATSSLPPAVKARPRWRLPAAGWSNRGVLLIDSRAFRTQAQNREAARERLIALIPQVAIRPRRRTATRPGRAARERRLTEKKQRASVKSGRGRARGSED